MNSRVSGQYSYAIPIRKYAAADFESSMMSVMGLVIQV